MAGGGFISFSTQVGSVVNLSASYSASLLAHYTAQIGMASGPSAQRLDCGQKNSVAYGLSGIGHIEA